MISDSVDDHQFLFFVGHNSGNVFIEFRTPGWSHEVGSVLHNADNVDIELGVSVGHMRTGVSEISPLRGLVAMHVTGVLST